MQEIMLEYNLGDVSTSDFSCEGNELNELGTPAVTIVDVGSRET